MQLNGTELVSWVALSSFALRRSPYAGVAATICDVDDMQHVNVEQQQRTCDGYRTASEAQVRFSCVARWLADRGLQRRRVGDHDCRSISDVPRINTILSILNGSCAVVRGFISPKVQFFGGLMAVGSDGGKDDIFLGTLISVWICMDIM